MNGTVGVGVKQKCLRFTAGGSRLPGSRLPGSRLLGATLVILTLASCGNVSKQPGSVAKSSVSKSSVAKSVTTQKSGSVGHALSSPHPKSAQSAPFASLPPLVGWGARRSVWDQNHHVDPLVGDTSYWPRFPNGTDSYTSVLGGQSRVTHYTVNLYPAETISDAVSRLRDELPPDVSVVSSNQEPPNSPKCEIVVMSSPLLASRVKASVVGRFESSTSLFNSSSVIRIALSPLALNSKTLPGC